MLEIRVVSPIEKVFPDTAPAGCAPRFSGMKNEVISFQLAFKNNPEWSTDRHILKLEIESEAKEFIRVRRVKYIPVRLAAFENADDNYLRGKQPGLYPDPLTEVFPHSIRTFGRTWESLWFDVVPDGKLPAGDYPVKLRRFSPLAVHTGQCEIRHAGLKHLTAGVNDRQLAPCSEPRIDAQRNPPLDRRLHQKMTEILSEHANRSG